MSDREVHGKEEEKEHEKGREKEEKYRRDPLSAVIWALILIWAGVVLLLSNAGVFDDVTILGSTVEAWSIGFIGAGVIVLLEVVIRLLVPTYRRPVGGTLVLAVVFIGVGLGEVVGWELIGPLILVAIGLSILLRFLFRSPDR